MTAVPPQSKCEHENLFSQYWKKQMNIALQLRPNLTKDKLQELKIAFLMCDSQLLMAAHNDKTLVKECEEAEGRLKIAQLPSKEIQKIVDAVNTRLRSV